MALLPEKNVDRLAFFSSRTALWTANATVIGTTTAQVTDVSAKVTAASAAIAAQILAQGNAKAATETVNLAMAALTNSGNVVIEQVRTKSRTAGDSVFPLANIPAPTTPVPVGELGKASDFTVTLTATGALELKWKCTNPVGASGTTYQIWRKIAPPSSGDFVFVGATGPKKFTDSTVPAGTTSVTYQIQATRSTSVGPVAEFNVNFGISGGRGIVSVVEVKPKLAA